MQIVLYSICRIPESVLVPCRLIDETVVNQNYLYLSGLYIWIFLYQTISYPNQQIYMNRHKDKKKYFSGQTACYPNRLTAK